MIFDINTLNDKYIQFISSDNLSSHSEVHDVMEAPHNVVSTIILLGLP